MMGCAIFRPPRRDCAAKCAHRLNAENKKKKTKEEKKLSRAIDTLASIIEADDAESFLFASAIAPNVSFSDAIDSFVFYAKNCYETTIEVKQNASICIIKEVALGEEEYRI